jgi:hypothetical protein
MIGKKEIYDTEFLRDPMAKPSQTIKKAHICDSHVYGDGDCWYEGVYYSTKKQAGEHRIYFQSQKTGRKSLGEPPTGASKVLYLKWSVKERMLKRREIAVVNHFLSSRQHC